MIDVIQRLEFSNVYPEEEKKDLDAYLAVISKDILLKTIGFCNIRPLPNYDEFFSDPDTAKNVFEKVEKYQKQHNITKQPELISQLASLKLAEQILSNKDTLFQGSKASTINEEEISLFKAFLIINEDLNKNQKLDGSSLDNKEKLIDYSIIFSFPSSDLAIFNDDKKQFIQLIYTTLIKVDYLFDFLKTKDDFLDLKKGLIESFGVNDIEDFFKEMKYLFGVLMSLKMEGNYILEVNEKKSQKFIEALVSDDILEDEDFTYIKIHPLYKIKNNQYSIINFYYVVDKFYRSTKFKIKDLYESDKRLKKKYGNFFSFFNKEFSENYLMKNVLEQIFHQKYIFKKEDREIERPGEPDYYVRNNNNIFLFENKDVLIAKKIKASGDISRIKEVLKQKFLGNENHSVGIGQIINSIKEILSGKFRFDDYVNKKNSLKVYPILLVHDRIFMTVGINYLLNQWYIKEVQAQIGEKYNSSNIKDLIVIDIDTLILWTPYLQRKDRNFRDILDGHLSKLKTKLKVNSPNYQYGLFIANNKLTDQITPISHRQINYHIPTENFIELFKEVIKD